MPHEAAIWKVHSTGRPAVWKGGELTLLSLNAPLYPFHFAARLQAADIVKIILDHGKLLPPQIFTMLQISDSKGTGRSSSYVICVYERALQLVPSIIKPYASWSLGRTSGHQHHYRTSPPRTG
jgi:hypothetical protein